MQHIHDFIGFYMQTGFWIGSCPDLSLYDEARRFTGMCAEIGYAYDCPAFMVAITIDGMVLLHHKEMASNVPQMGDPTQIEKALSWWDEFLDYAYALQAIIESETMRVAAPFGIAASEVAPDYTSTIGMIDWFPVRRNWESGRVINEQLRDLEHYIRYVSKHGEVPSEITFSPYSWPKVKVSTLDSAMRNFEYICAHPRVLKWLAFVTRSKVAYSKNDFAMSLLQSWFVIESVCNQLYDDSPHIHVRGNRKNVKAKHIIDLLSQDGKLAAATAHDLHEVRKVRNGLVHSPETTRCSSRLAALAGNLASSLSMHGHPFGVDLLWQCGVRY
ncbi:hypothetical protein GTP44_15455 [Duganella sp. FT50W]|uniref:Apea-like HEPN domain-containing protein n=1 Tax=Duganella lactea TaxID=2692173 RepID=A0A6L8MQ55_9BURK|nr:hypothetical protein [Duganella lactea]MYM83345.1 hypothetical protein [Duganella lactea]